CLSRAPALGGFWPLVGARLSSLAVLGALLLAGLGERRLARDALPPAALSGVLDMTANALFLLALRHGELVLVAVLVSLSPAAMDRGDAQAALAAARATLEAGDAPAAVPQFERAIALSVRAGDRLLEAEAELELAEAMGVALFAGRGDAWGECLAHESMVRAL